MWSRFEGVVGVVYSYAFVGVSNLPFKVSRKASRSLFFVFYYGIVIFFCLYNHRGVYRFWLFMNLFLMVNQQHFRPNSPA